MIAMPDMTMSTSPAFNAGSSSGKGLMTNSTSTPSASATSFARSTSSPMRSPDLFLTLSDARSPDMPTRIFPLSTIRVRTGDSGVAEAAAEADRNTVERRW